MDSFKNEDQTPDVFEISVKRKWEAGIIYFHLSCKMNCVLSSDLIEFFKVKHLRITSGICPHALLWIGVL